MNELRRSDIPGPSGIKLEKTDGEETGDLSGIATGGLTQGEKSGWVSVDSKMGYNCSA